MSPYEKAMAALKHGGFLTGGKPLCPTCPPSKRRGFKVTEGKTAAGIATVLFHCFRGCDTLTEIVPALGLDPADLYDGGMRQEMLFKTDRYCRITTQGWKALSRGSARTFGIAASIGYYPSTRSAFTLLRSPQQWEAVRREADIKPNELRREIRTWVSQRMAHRCDWGFLSLYRGPLERCPNCGRLSLEGSTTTRKYARGGEDAGVLRHEPDAKQRTVKMLASDGDNPGEFAWKTRYPEGDGAPDRGQR